ncbi:3-ketoacyl-CoA synthase 11 [Hordeum vulgare]|nr:3-ketoacyl-CoA synthase 11 [Hordeum vulgare]
MEALQERMLQEFAEIRAAPGKLTLVYGICEQLAALNAKLSEQTVHLDQVQMKVNLSCDALSQVQQHQQFQAGQRNKQQVGRRVHHRQLQTDQRAFWSSTTSGGIRFTVSGSVVPLSAKQIGERDELSDHRQLARRKV